MVLGPHTVGGKDVLPGPLAPLGRKLGSRFRRLPVPLPALVPALPLQFVHEDDVGSALLQCIVAAGPPGAYNIAGDGVLSAVDVARELGRGCSSTGWVAAQFLIHNWNAARIDERAQQEYYSAPDVTCATALAMTRSEVHDVAGGIRLSGEWQFSSGIDHADWLWIMTISSATIDGALIPRGQFEIVDDWNVIGLLGTGSKSVRLDERPPNEL